MMDIKRDVKNVTIVGLGLMGGSLGMALKKKLLGVKVRGVDLCLEVIQEAQAMGAIDDGTVDLGEGVTGADIIFLATPVAVMPVICRKMVPYLSQGAIVTDLGSTKTKPVACLEDILLPRAFFLGGHPMTGSEKKGLKGANEYLFENAAYILTPTVKTKVEVINTVKITLERLGTRIIFLSPEEHDRKVAAVSHLPHVLVSALVNTVGFLEEEEGGYYTLAAGGFRDTTRIAGSQSEMWCNIFLQNKQFLLPLIKQFRQVLSRYEHVIEKEEHVALRGLLEQARLQREKVPTGLKGILPRIFEFTVMVPDQPGVLAELTGLFKKDGLNISDIEIQRSREENEGTLRLGFVNQENRDQAIAILQSNGYKVMVTK
jgi:prephenate dehydrogenase